MVNRTNKSWSNVSELILEYLLVAYLMKYLIQLVVDVIYVPHDYEVLSLHNIKKKTNMSVKQTLAAAL